MRLAFIISAYKLPHQVVRLVSRLQAPGRTFYIHVDANAPDGVAGTIATGLSSVLGVTLLDRHPCAWGDFGHVRATLKGLDAIDAAGDEPEYVLLLTGQDYPIKSNAALDETLGAAGGRSFMNFRPLPVAGLERGGFERLPSPYLPDGLPPYFGSGYWTLHREAIAQVRDYLAAHPGYVPYFEQVTVPDEMFFQSILLNSPLRDTIVNDDQRFIKWPGPAVLGLEAFDELSQAADLFARKFDDTLDAAVLDRIDQAWLR